MRRDNAIGRISMKSAVLLALLGLLAACGDGKTGAPEKKPNGGEPAPKAESGVVKIGVAGPKTGKEAKNGQDLIEGTTLAVEEWNAKGGVLGRKIDVVVRDDEALAKNASVVATELIDAGVAGVVGHFNTDCTLPASENYHDAGIPMITPASTNVKVTDRRYPNVFRVCGRDDQQGATAADFVTNVLKLKKVAVIDDRSGYGKGLADAFEKSLGKSVEVTGHDGFDKESDNFRPYLTIIKEKGAELIYFGGIYHQAVPIIQQARDMGINAPLMAGDGVHGYQADFLDKLGPLANGTYTTFPNVEAAPGFVAFTQKYKERFKADPGPYAIYSYASAQILLESIQKAGTTEGPKVSAAIHSGSFDTPVGKIEFDDKGDIKATGYYTVWVVKDGKHVLAGAQ
jgi:branched-chain amino acid transport system substrate-binding protein